MTIEIHSAKKAAIFDDLVARLPEMQVTNNKYLDLKSAINLFLIDQRLPKKTRESAADLIDEHPLFEFITEYISSDLCDLNEWSDVPSKPLIDISHFSDVEKYSSLLIDSFQSLPWSYTLSLEMPDVFLTALTDGENALVLSNRMRLIKVSDTFDNEFPLKSPFPARERNMSPLSLLFMPSEPKWTVGSIILQQQCSGFIGEFSRTATLRKGDLALRSFLGILIGLRAITIKPGYSLNVPHRDLIIHQNFASGWRVKRRLELDYEFSRAIPGILVDDLDGRVPEDSRGPWLRYNLIRLMPALDESEEAQRIRLAARWLFDSVSNSQRLLSFVQAMVCLEILLGETDVRDPLGLGATIRNRCAYLIAGSYEEREKISAELREIYEVRSKILHRGQDDLSSKETSMLLRLRHICGRVIGKELELLKDQFDRNVQAEQVNKAAAVEETSSGMAVPPV